jgi:hypothetical protein
MRKILTGLLLLSVISAINAQNPATTFTIANRVIQLPCGTSCTPISVQVPHIKQTSSYIVTTPSYVPFAYTTPSGNVVSSIYIDDTWSQPIALPFSFCFYNNSFTSVLTLPSLLMSVVQDLEVDILLAVPRVLSLVLSTRRI